MRTSRFLVTAALVAAAAVPVSLSGSPVAAETPTELFFSEYIEGSSNNKALEIHNGTGAAIDLAAGGYNVQMYSNGNVTANVTINLTGTAADGDVFVVAQALANADILAQADQTNSSGWFNGNDAVVLRKGDAFLDVIGQVGFDPGTEWGTGLTSTADNTLRRKAAICAGDPDGSDAFDPSVEWDGFATNTVDGLGSHTTTCDDNGGGGTETPVINEFVANHTGIDTNEYIEIFGLPSTDLSAYTILQIEGDFSGTATGFVDSATTVGTTDAAGFWTTGFLADVIENGTLTLLLVENFTGTVGTDLDTNDDGIFDVTPWDAIVDAVAVSDGGANDLTYGVPVLGVAFDGMPFAPGGASRIPNGTDTDTTADWMRNNFGLAGIPGFTGTPVVGEAINTPNAPNVAYELPPPPPEECGDPFTAIPAIQGSGLASPLLGDTVSTEGVVVGRFVDHLTGFDTIFIQDPIGDSDPTTSDGIYVNADAAGIATGATVRVVSGSVVELRTRTQIDGVAALLDCGPTNETIEPVELALPMTDLTAFERYEGMLVTFPQPLVISEYFNFGRFGEIVLTTDRQFQPTAVFEPGSIEAANLAVAHALSRITLDDGRSVQNPDPAIHPNGKEFTLENLFRGGDEVANVTGALDYNFSLWRVQPTTGADYTAINDRPAVPDVGGDLQVASFNVLNYFTTLDSRGANTPEELDRQEAKIVAAIAALDAEVVGLIEIENNDEAIQRLVGAINDVVGAGTYAYLDTGVIGTDEIKVAFIYRPAAVELVGDYAVLDSDVDPRFDDTLNRPALAQTFRAIGDDGAFGVPFTVTVNHLKSKGSDCLPDDPDTGDGSGNCNLTRTAAAEAIVDWLASDPTGSGSDTHLVIGDLNAYDKETPIDALLAGGYTDLLAEFQGEFAYTYVFNGQLGYLDHALANETLLGAVTGADAWLINADEASLIDYDMTFKLDAQDALFARDPFRSSDHDPVLVGLDVCAVDTAPTLDVSVTPEVLRPPNHRYRFVEATVIAADAEDGDVTVELVSVTSNEPDNGKGDGNTVNDIVILDDTTFLLRAERSGQGNGRVYTITYSVTDSCGVTTTATAEVTVPKR